MKFFSTCIAIAMMLIAPIVTAQEIRYCGQTEKTQALFERFPHLEHPAVQAEMNLEEEEAERGTQGGGGDEVLYIPIVFHIIHDNGDENISDEQIYSALEVLNRDFRKLNPDISQVNEAFSDITADIGIEFRLAKRDPQGNCTKGINRIQSPLTYDGGMDMQDLIQWPRNRYLNVWVCAYAAGAAGYTYLPGTVNNPFMANYDGIVLLHTYTGNMGTSNNFRSRTLTHEVGHWLNLRHTWGPGNSPGSQNNCDQDDNVDDTPNTVGWQSCNTNGESCGSLDNVQNYMEYSYCSRMFTQGQRSRMRTAAQSSTAQRQQLITAGNHAQTGIFEDALLCSAEFYINQDVVCVGEPVQFFDDSFHGVTEWTWQISDGTVISGDDPEVHRNPVIVFENSGVFDVTLIASNESGSVQTTKQSFVKVLPQGALPNPFSEGFEDGIAEDTWFIFNEYNNVTWELTGSAAYDGERSVRVRNINNSIESSNDELISTTMDLSGATHATITYYYAYTNRLVETDDRLRVSVSGDCGENWSLRKLHRGFTDLPTAPAQNAPFVPSGPDQWSSHTVTVNSPDHLTSNFRFKFGLEGRGGNNLYLDNINIQVFGQEVGVSENGLENRFNLYPNPMNETATLRYTMANEDRVRITLHDITGREVRLLTDRSEYQGEHQIEIAREGLAKGMYIIRAQVGTAVQSMRLLMQ